MPHFKPLTLPADDFDVLKRIERNQERETPLRIRNAKILLACATPGFDSRRTAGVYRLNKNSVLALLARYREVGLEGALAVGTGKAGPRGRKIDKATMDTAFRAIKKPRAENEAERVARYLARHPDVSVNQLVKKFGFHHRIAKRYLAATRQLRAAARPPAAKS